jgi:hypothetical protein
MARISVHRENKRERNSSRQHTDDIVITTELRQRRLRELLRTLEQLSWRTYLKGKTRGVR